MTIMAVAFARFILSDVLDVDGDPAPLPLGACGTAGRQGTYTKLNLCSPYALSPLTATQTPQFDLSAVYGTSGEQQSGLRAACTAFLDFRQATQPSDYAIFDMQPDPNDIKLFVAGHRYANLDHFSLYMHTRFVYLHNRIARWLLACAFLPSDGVTLNNVFAATRVFVQMIAKSIVQEFVGPYGPLSRKLPGVPYPLIAAEGIPTEFLLVNFFDAFPSTFAHYFDTQTGKPTLNPPVVYRTTMFNTTGFVPDDVWTSSSTATDFETTLAADVPPLAFVGWNAMFTQAQYGGSFQDQLRCGTAFENNGQQYDVVAAAIQRGRDHYFPNCNEYRDQKGLPPITFADFGNSNWTMTFAALHNADVGNVELSVCLLLDPDLRYRMLSSLIDAVLLLDTSAPCAGSSTTQYNFASTAVAQLDGFPLNCCPNLANLMTLVCENVVKVSMRALVMPESLQIDSGGVHFASLVRSKFYECTTGNPWMNAASRYTSNSTFVMENAVAVSPTPVNTAPFCNWKDRVAPIPSGPYTLHNAPACWMMSPPLGGNNARLRQCFDAVETACLDRGLRSGTSNCVCDPGFHAQVGASIKINGASATNPIAATLACEHYIFPASDRSTTDQFAASNFAKSAGSCSSTYMPNGAISNPGLTTAYCTTLNTSVCGSMVSVGHTTFGGCHSAQDADAGRVGSTLSRIHPAVYPNGISDLGTVDRPTFEASFTALYPPDSTIIQHTSAFRAIGSLLNRDVFRPVAGILNISGARTGTSTSNPAQFRNAETAWIDLSPLYGVPTTLDPTGLDRAIISLADANSFTQTQTLTSRYDTISWSSEEISLLYLFAARHNAFYAAIDFYSSSGSGASANAIAGVCARELVIEEWRAIAGQYITAAQCLVRVTHGDNQYLRFPSTDGAVPVEMGAAQIFNLHHAPQNPSMCGTPTLNGALYNRTCIVNAASNRLVFQRDVSALTSDEFTSFTKAQYYGLATVDDYVTKLGANFDFRDDIHPSLHIGLHGSAASYAINFGTIANLLGAQNAVRNATAACMNAAGGSPNMGKYMPGGSNPIVRATSFQELLSASGFSGPAPPPTPFYQGAC